jgi:hypothetical protein
MQPSTMTDNVKCLPTACGAQSEQETIESKPRAVGTKVSLDYCAGDAVFTILVRYLFHSFTCFGVLLRVADLRGDPST